MSITYMLCKTNNKKHTTLAVGLLKAYNMGIEMVTKAKFTAPSDLFLEMQYLKSHLECGVLEIQFLFS